MIAVLTKEGVKEGLKEGVKRDVVVFIFGSIEGIVSEKVVSFRLQFCSINIKKRVHINILLR
jgi:hypothetical protein